jgi:hypothetical protein
MFSKKSYSGIVHANKGGFNNMSSIYISSQSSIGAISQTLQKGDKQYVNELMKYDKLNHIILSAFNTYMTQFKTGQFDLLENSFTSEEALRLGQLLTGDNLSTFSARDKFKFLKSTTMFSAYTTTTQNFDTYKSFMHTLIDGLTSATNLHKQNEQLQITNKDLAEYRDTLSDLDKLKKYIDNNYLNFSIGLFSTEQTVTTQFGIKEEYQIYINTYGMPGPDGFDSLRLANILYDISIR